MLLIATLVQNPGVGGAQSDDQGEAEYHDTLKAVQTRLQKVAAASGIDLPEGYPATPTTRKDWETLPRYSIHNYLIFSINQR